LTGADLRIQADKEATRIATFIERTIRDASAKGAVVALSGGIDSAVVGALCVKALGKERVFGLLLPSDHTPSADMKDARGMADSWGIRVESIPISKAAESLTASASIERTKIASANVEARLRMTLLYYFANVLGFLVAGTGDRSEAAIGYFTKGGDGQADFLPIAHLYKTQVRQLGAHLGLPTAVVGKPSSPQLWSGQKATDEIPADYDKLDVVLHWLFDMKVTPARAAEEAGVTISVAERALDMHRRSEHKRSLPPSLV
jgi:NAD+ synthase